MAHGWPSGALLVDGRRQRRRRTIVQSQVRAMVQCRFAFSYSFSMPLSACAVVCVKKRACKAVRGGASHKGFGMWVLAPCQQTQHELSMQCAPVDP
jgi:hypothetical protein